MDNIIIVVLEYIECTGKCTKLVCLSSIAFNVCY